MHQAFWVITKSNEIMVNQHTTVHWIGGTSFVIQSQNLKLMITQKYQVVPTNFNMIGHWNQLIWSLSVQIDSTPHA